VISQDGRFIAFSEEDGNSLVIHKVEFMTEELRTLFQSNNIDVNEVLYDPRKPPKKSAVSLTTSPSITALPLPSSPVTTEDEKKVKKKKEPQRQAIAS
jgi:hypothetical protein